MTQAETERAATWAAIRERTAGTRVVVVSNRVDKTLQKVLEKKLGTKIRWAVAKQRQVDALGKSIRDGTYDLVIVFTGFMYHRTDTALSQAALRGDAVYVRADRGRPQTVMLALARDFGL